MSLNSLPLHSVPPRTPSANPFNGLRRADWPRLTESVIHRGSGYQSSVYLVCVDGRRAAIKDFNGTPRFFRFLVAPYLVQRETRVLRHLQGVEGVPKYFGRLDRLSFAMEYIEGTPLDTFARGELPSGVFERAQRVIDAIHARGVAHGDLKRRSNLILTPDGSIYVIDFAAAIIGRRPLRPFVNWLQREAARVDDKSVPRLKKFVAPELLTESDREKLDNPTKLERWARRLLNR